MKIGFDAKRLFNNSTGLGNYSRTLVSNMIKYFPENEYILFSNKISNKYTQNLNLDKTKIVLPKNYFNPFWRSFGISKEIEKEKVDIYHGLSNEIPFNLKKAKSVVTIHDLIFKIYPKTYPFFDRITYETKFKFSCQQSDKIIAISESTKRDIIKFYGIPEEKIEVIYQTCNRIFFDEQQIADFGNMKEKFRIPNEYLLYVGSVIERKNLLGIINSYSILPKDLQIPLVVVGNSKGKYAENVRKEVRRLKLENKILWLNNVENPLELKMLYQNAQIFLYPSKYEGFGIPIIEALLSKVPVITSNISSLPEAAGSDSILVNPEKIEEIANAIKIVLMQTDLRTKMIENGNNFAREKFNERKLTEELEKLYSKMIWDI
jgi:glycosyltransferase involved in cell wall biosynthesis